MAQKAHGIPHLEGSEMEVGVEGCLRKVAGGGPEDLPPPTQHVTLAILEDRPKLSGDM